MQLNFAQFYVDTYLFFTHEHKFVNAESYRKSMGKTPRNSRGNLFKGVVYRTLCIPDADARRTIERSRSIKRSITSKNPTLNPRSPAIYRLSIPRLHRRRTDVEHGSAEKKLKNVTDLGCQLPFRRHLDNNNGRRSTSRLPAARALLLQFLRWLRLCSNVIHTLSPLVES